MRLFGKIFSNLLGLSFDSVCVEEMEEYKKDRWS